MWPYPERITLEGSYCRLVPIELEHADRLYEIVSGPNAEARYRWIPNLPHKNREEFDSWLANEVNTKEMVTFVIVNKETNQIEGRQSLMRIAPEHGVVEVGYVIWGTGMARTRIATEAFFLHANYCLETLGYRRYEWKCDNDNVPSRNAATRFGFSFEGVFHQHLIIKGVNRDTAWFSILDKEWPKLKDSFVKWLDHSNFSDAGQQIQKLGSFRV
jgi:RimJ/RimL family protein N-acetyltransferase